MLTIKQITENTNAVIRGLEKKHFKNAKETIDQVIAFNDKRRSTQSILDNNLSEVNSISKSIGQLMKEGKKEEAETAKSRVAELKQRELGDLQVFNTAPPWSKPWRTSRRCCCRRPARSIP